MGNSPLRLFHGLGHDSVLPEGSGQEPGQGGFMRPFAQILTGSKLSAALGDDEKAVVMYGSPRLLWRPLLAGCD